MLRIRVTAGGRTLASGVCLLGASKGTRGESTHDVTRMAPRAGGTVCGFTKKERSTHWGLLVRRQLWPHGVRTLRRCCHADSVSSAGPEDRGSTPPNVVFVLFFRGFGHFPIEEKSWRELPRWQQQAVGTVVGVGEITHGTMGRAARRGWRGDQRPYTGGIITTGGCGTTIGAMGIGAA